MMTLKHRWCSIGILGTWVEPVLRGPRKRSGDRLIGENTRLLTFVAIRRDIRNVATRAVAVRKCCQCDSHTVGLPTEVVPGKLLVVRIGRNDAVFPGGQVQDMNLEPRALGSGSLTIGDLLPLRAETVASHVVHIGQLTDFAFSVVCLLPTDGQECPSYNLRATAFLPASLGTGRLRSKSG